MKNKLFVVVLLALIVPVLFVGCGKNKEKVKAPKDVKVSEVTDTDYTPAQKYVLVTWEGTSFVEGYEVFARQKDKKTVTYVAYGQNFYTFDAKGRAFYWDAVNSKYIYNYNSDTDKWSQCMSFSYLQNILPPGTYEFGVRSYVSMGFGNEDISKVVWSDGTIALPAP